MDIWIGLLKKWLVEFEADGCSDRIDEKTAISVRSQCTFGQSQWKNSDVSPKSEHLWTISMENQLIESEVSTPSDSLSGKTAI